MEKLFNRIKSLAEKIKAHLDRKTLSEQLAKLAKRQLNYISKLEKDHQELLDDRDEANEAKLSVEGQQLRAAVEYNNLTEGLKVQLTDAEQVLGVFNQKVESSIVGIGEAEAVLEDLLEKIEEAEGEE